jgi:hypothetical protein
MDRTRWTLPLSSARLEVRLTRFSGDGGFFQRDPPCSRDVVPWPQAPLCGLRRLGVQQISLDSFACLLIACFGSTGRLVNRAQNRLRGPVKLVATTLWTAVASRQHLRRFPPPKSVDDPDPKLDRLARPLRWR